MTTGRLQRLPWKPKDGDGFPIYVSYRVPNVRRHPEPMHSHEFFTLFLVHAGKGKLGTVAGELDMSAGDAHVLPPGEPHQTDQLGSCEGWVVEFTADALGETAGFAGNQLGGPAWVAFQAAGQMRDSRLRLPKGIHERVESYCTELKRTIEERGAFFHDAARAILRLVVIQLAQTVESGKSFPPVLSPVVREALSVIQTRFHEPSLGLAEVAKAVGRSPSYLTNVVKAETRLTVLEWIRARRLDEARRRLQSSDEDVGILAERVGYGSVDHFIRQFRRTYGMTPGAWRRRLTVMQR